MLRKLAVIMVAGMLAAALAVAAEDAPKEQSGGDATPQSLLEQGCRDWEVAPLEKCVSLTRSGKDFASLLARGKCRYRLLFVHSVRNENAKATHHGELAIADLDEALELDESSVEARAYLGLALHLMTGLGAGKAIRYGPRAASVLDDLTERAHGEFLVRLLEAIHYLETPAIFGGDSADALQLLAALARQYPENEDVQAYLAKAYLKEEFYDKAMEIAKKVIDKNPKNIFAIDLYKTARMAKEKEEKRK